MAAVVRAKEEDGGWCSRHPRHRHSLGVCPFCLRDRLWRLSAAAAASPASPASSSASSFSPCSSGEGSVGPAQAPPFREARRARLGLLMRQEKREAVAAGAGPGAGCRGQEGNAPGEKREAAAKRGGFWARLQQQLQHGGWHRKDGCSLSQSRADAEEIVAPKRAPPLF